MSAELPPNDEAIVRALEMKPDEVGRSKRVWKVGEDHCVVELIPSLSSFTFQREAVISGTAELRLDFYERAASALSERGIPVAFERRIGPTRYLARYCPSPPFETIVKNYAYGSTLRKYPGLFAEGAEFAQPVVKFDYRTDPEDQPIGEGYLDLLGLPHEHWKKIALSTNDALREWLAPRVLIDFCLILGQDAQGTWAIASEISPDGMRLRDSGGNSLDKDLFRQGESAALILRKWSELVQSLPQPHA